MNACFEVYDIKRTLEMWSSGLYEEEFRLVVAGQSEKLSQGIIPCVAQLLVESRQLKDEPLLANYFDNQNKHIEWRDMIRRDSAPKDPRYRAWRERQMNRCHLEISKTQNAAIIHVLSAFELTRGCSVNCWFCSMEPGPLKGIFRYTPENAKLWHEVLTSLIDIVGQGAKWSSSYWGTEPMDNPDYENFCRDYFAIYGTFPQTTTAVPLRDVERTRALLAESHSKGCRVNRFSIHDAEEFRGVMASFSALEMANTELLLENPERIGAPMVMAGKLLNMRETMPEIAAREEEKVISMMKFAHPDIAAEYDAFEFGASYLDEGQGNSDTRRYRLAMPSTNTCMSGFLVNMVAKTVELVSPCAADASWPKGYIIFDQGSFDSGDSFRKLLLRMIDDNMPEKVLPTNRVALTRRANYRQTEKGFVLSSIYGRVGYENEKMGQYLAHLGNSLRKGGVRPGEIALECFYLFNKHEDFTLGLITDLFNRGLLETEKNVK